MRVLKRNVIFWGKNVLLNLGYSLVGTLLLIIFIGTGNNRMHQNFLSFMVPMFPYYLFMVGFFVNTIMGQSNFRVYFRVLLSMGITRREATAGFLGSLAASNLGIMLLAWLIWALVPGDLSGKGLQMFSLLSGVLFVTAGVIAICGTVVMRWGKIGSIVTGIFYMVLGGGWGFLLSYAIEKGLNEGFLIWTADISQNICRRVLAVGLGGFLLCGLFAAYTLRKTEVR